jgi:hypothetical protein
MLIRLVNPLIKRSPSLAQREYMQETPTRLPVRTIPYRPDKPHVI